MANEENLDWLHRLKSAIYVYMPKEWLTPMNNALDDAIKALSAEPQGDLISRKAVLNTLDNMDKALNENRAVEAYKDLLKECFKELLPVEQQEWISPTTEPVSTEEAKKLLYQEFKGKMKDGNPRLLVAYEIAMKALEAQTER